MQACSPRTRVLSRRLWTLVTGLMLAGGCAGDPSITSFRDAFVSGFGEGLKTILGAFVDASIASTVGEDSSQQ